MEICEGEEAEDKEVAVNELKEGYKIRRSEDKELFYDWKSTTWDGIN